MHFPIFHQPELPALRAITSELLACIVLQLFPGTLLKGATITEWGFSYDFVFPKQPPSDYLPFLEQQMREAARQNIPFTFLEMMRENAANLLLHHQQPLQAETVLNSASNIVQIIKIEDFYDLCPFPSSSSIAPPRNVKILEMETIPLHLPSNEQIIITRIIGTAFPHAKDLKDFCKLYAIYKKNNYITLGSFLQLLAPYPYKDSSAIAWLPKGTAWLNILYSRWKKEQQERGFVQIRPPHSFDFSFHEWSFQHSNHDHPSPLQFYEFSKKQKKNSSEQQDNDFFHTDLCSVFCQENEVNELLNSSLQFICHWITLLEVEARWVIKLRSQIKRQDQEWLQNGKRLVKALEKCGLRFIVDDRPDRIDVPVAQAYWTDSLGRTWMGPWLSHSRITGEKSKYSIQYSTFGNLDQAMALIIEKTNGSIPFWMNPEQIRILPIGDNKATADFGNEVWLACKEQFLRCTVDFTQEKLGAKIHKAEKASIPYLLVVGMEEAKNRLVNVRSCIEPKLDGKMSIEEFFRHLPKR